MRFRRIVATVCWIGLLMTPALAQDPGGEDAETMPAPAELDDQPCVIDAQLSMWLSLESADRMIAALEIERRELTLELASLLKSLDLLLREANPEGVGLAELASLLAAKAAGRDALEDNYAEVQNRLIGIDRTLKRRYRQQAMLESRLEEAMEASDAEDAAPAR